MSQLDEKQTAPQVLVLTPTRELAIQVAEAFQSYAKHIKGFHVLPIYGGADIGGQLRGLKRGAQVVVGTQVGCLTICVVGVWTSARSKV